MGGEPGPLPNSSKPWRVLLYHGGMCLGLLCQEVEELGAPNLGLTLDVGHACLGAPFWSKDFGSALAEAAPYVQHLHWHDNFGRLEGLSPADYDRLPNGEGDLHLPPGWGSMPLDAVRRWFEGYSGWLTIEIRPRYRAHY